MGRVRYLHNDHVSGRGVVGKHTVLRLGDNDHWRDSSIESAAASIQKQPGMILTLRPVIRLFVYAA